MMRFPLNSWVKVLLHAVKGTLLFCVFTLPLLVSRLFFRPFETPKDALFVCSMALCAAGMLLASLFSPQITLFRKSRLTLAVCCYVVYTILNATIFPYTDRIYWLNISGCFLLFFVVSAMSDDHFRTRLLQALGLVALLLAIYGTNQFFGVEFLNPYGSYFNSQLPFGTRIFVTLGNPNLVGGFYVLLLPIIAACWLRAFQERRRSAWLWGFIFIYSGIALLMSQTRGSWLCAAVALMLFLVFALKQSFLVILKKYARFSALFVILILLGSYAAFLKMSAATKLTTTSSWNERMVFYETTWRMIKNSPLFGHGIGTFSIYYNYIRDERDMAQKWGGVALHPRVMHAHNEHLEQLHDGGIIGYGLFLWLIVEALRLLFRRKDVVFYGLAAALIGILLDGLLMQNLRHTVIAALFWLLIGLANGGEPAIFTAAVTPARLRPFLPLAVFCAIVLLGLPCVFEYRLLQAAYYAKAARMLYNSNLPQSALQWYRKSVVAYPYDTQVLYDAADCYVRLNDQASALIVYQRILKRAPYFLDTHFRMGELYQRQGDLRQASASFQQQTAIDNMHWESYAQLAFLAYEQGHVEEADAFFNELLDIQKIRRGKFVPAQDIEKLKRILEKSGSD
ncbi:O-antigen polymerase [Candidatus Moduliflexus flocculans]|uniref:O-antigen polymerase n=1 Tax=Candidatus Moduliflexus flocculans TaxID=1499966 RepID=A0A0S6W548_9BACT|nr:O-antigen polymerase [Candidatus Moduliflexus flocculans]